MAWGWASLCAESQALPEFGSKLVERPDGLEGGADDTALKMAVRHLLANGAKAYVEQTTGFESVVARIAPERWRTQANATQAGNAGRASLTVRETIGLAGVGRVGCRHRLVVRVGGIARHLGARRPVNGLAGPPLVVQGNPPGG